MFRKFQSAVERGDIIIDNENVKPNESKATATSVVQSNEFKDTSQAIKLDEIVF